MNKRYTFAALVAACTLTFTSCSNDENDLRTAEDQVNITASVANTVHTRADGVTDYAPANGTLTVLYGSMNAASQQATYTYANNAWTANGTPLYWDELAAVNNTYPFFAAAPTAPAALPSVAADQNAAGAYAASDQLLAYTTAARKQQVGFTFRHVLSQVSIAITSSNTTDADYIDPSTAIITAKGALTAYSLSYATPTADAPAVATATGNADATLTAFASGTGSARKHFLVLPPQTLASDGLTLTITLGSNSYTWKNTEALTLAAGKSNAINLVLKKSGMTLSDIKLVDWDNSPVPVNGNLAIIVSGSAESTTGNAPAFSSIKLWKGEAAFADTDAAPADAKTYTKDAAGAWSTTATPYYIDDILAADRFYTLAQNTKADGTTPIVDAKTGLKDLVAAGPASMKAGAVALTHKHLMAKLCVTLAAGTGFNAALITNAATIATPAMKPGFKLAYATSDKSIEAIPDGTAAAYTGLAAATDYIVAPQTIAAATDFTVTLSNGNTYTAKLASAITLEGGKIHTLALTLSPSAASLAVSVTDWAVGGTSNQSIVVDGISTDTASSGTLAPGAGDQLALTYLANGALSTDATQKATYTYAANAWGSTAPLYWDAIGAGATGTTHSFVALYTPAATPSAGCVKDYLTGKTAAAFGAPIQFTTDATKLTHAMSQISITLLPGKGYAANPASPTDPEKNALIAALTTRHLLLNSLQSIAVDKDGQGVVTLAAGAPANILATATDKNFASGTTYTVTPQTLTDAHTVVLKLANGNAYTLKLTDLKTTDGKALFGADKKMMPGAQYAVSITVSETEVSFAASIRPWNSISGSGEVVPGI